LPKLLKIALILAFIIFNLTKDINKIKFQAVVSKIESTENLKLLLYVF